MNKVFLFLLFATLHHFAFSQKNLELQANVTYSQNLSDIWGYTDSVGNEYALVCLRSGVAIENITDPTNPQNVAIIPGPSSTWRDAKTIGHFSYYINETGAGLQVINLENLPNAPDSTDSYFWTPIIPGLGQLSTCHNIYIDTETGYGFLAGCNVNNGGIIIIDLVTDPGNPIFVAAASSTYAHDVFARGDYMYTSDIFDGAFAIHNIANKDSIFTISSQTTPFTFTHNAWLSDDGNTIFTTDERNNASVGAYDISDMNNIQYLDEFRPLSSVNTGLIPHNVHVKDDFLVTSFYTEGIVITDANRPQNLIEVGNYDTFAGGNGSFGGVWGAYPFFESGTVLGSDSGTGLYVLKPNYTRACYLEGEVTDSITGMALSGVLVNIISDDANNEISAISGAYKTGQVTAGDFDVTYSKSGYTSKTITASLTNGEVTVADIALAPIIIDSTTTSIPVLEGVEQFTAYPNPFNGKTIIQFELLDLAPSTSLVVKDLLGREVYQQSITQSKGYLELGDNWEAGIYFIQIMTDNALSSPLKIVKNSN